MKVLFIEFHIPYLLKDAEYPSGGWTNELFVWLQGLQHCDCKVGVLTWKGASEYVGKDLPFELIDTYKRRTGIKFLRYFYVYIPALIKTTREFGPDIIIQSSSGIETGIMAYVAQHLKVPFVHRIASDRDADDRVYKTHIPFYAKLAYRYGLHKTTATICQNQYQRHAMEKRYPEKHHYVLHNPFTALRGLPAPQGRSGKSYVAWVGIFKYEKNLPLLYEIARQLSDMTFKVAGMKGQQVDLASEAALEKLKELKNVELVGFLKRKDILDFLRNAIVLLSTSHYEGFSNVLLEAMAVGTPVVLPSRVDPDNIIAQNQLGLASENDEELPILLQQTANMPDEEYHAMSDRSRLYIKEHHDPTLKASEMLSILRNVSLPCDPY